MADNVQRSDMVSVRDILYVLFRHKWIILVVTVAAIAVVGYSFKIAPDRYESNAKLLLTQTADSSAPGANLDPTVAETQLLESRGFAEAVVERVGPAVILQAPPADSGEMVLKETSSKLLKNLGLTPFSPDGGPPDPSIVREDAVERFMSSFVVGVEPRSNVVSLSYEAYSPHAAQQILNAAVAVYMDKHVEIHSMSASVQLLADQTDLLKARLEMAKLALSGYEERMHVAQFDEQRTLLMQRIESLRSQIQSAEAESSAARAAVAATENKLGMRLVELEHRVGLESLDARLGVLRQQLQAGEAELSNMTVTQRRLEELDADVKSADAEYRSYQSSLEKVRIARALESERIANLGTLESPTYLMSPKAGGKRVALLGAIAAILGGVAVAFLLERMNHTVRTPADIRARLQLDSMSFVPPVRVKVVRNRLRNEIRRRKRLGGSHEPVPMELAKHVVTWMYFVDEMRECFEQLRARIELATAASGKRPYVLAITSCYRGEGVSSVAAGLAYSVAFAEGERVLLLNSNYHHPERDVVPDNLRPAGLTERELQHQLIDPPEMSPKQFGNGGGNGHSMASEGTKPVDDIPLSAGRPDFKFVVMDLPSLREGGAAAVGARDADGTLLVVESERVRREVVQTSVEKLQQAGVRILGVVLNKRKFYIPDWLYRVS